MNKPNQALGTAPTIASLCWTVWGASTLRRQATPRRQLDATQLMSAWRRELDQGASTHLPVLCSHGASKLWTHGTNGGSAFPRLWLGRETPKRLPVLSGSRVVLFFPGSWAVGRARCLGAGGLLTLQEPGRQLQKANLQCIPIFQNRKNKTNHSRCSNM